MNLILYETTGEITGLLQCPDDHVELQDFGGRQHMEGVATFERNYVDVSVTPHVIATFPAKPSDLHKWEWGSLSWELPSDALDTAIRNKQSAVNDLRAEKLAAGVTYNGNRYDTNDVALANLTRTASSAALLGGVPPGFVWRDADNHDIPHTLDSFKALVGVAMNYGNAVYQHSFVLKDTIAAMTDIGAVEAFDITAGWPG